ncbi:hypothetical protein [Chitinophaga lutea]|nr:hypothetical protein [Chitinophaga lutea]
MYDENIRSEIDEPTAELLTLNAFCAVLALKPNVSIANIEQAVRTSCSGERVAYLELLHRAQIKPVRSFRKLREQKEIPVDGPVDDFLALFSDVRSFLLSRLHEGGDIKDIAKKIAGFVTIHQITEMRHRLSDHLKKVPHEDLQIFLKSYIAAVPIVTQVDAGNVTMEEIFSKRAVVYMELRDAMSVEHFSFYLLCFRLHYSGYNHQSAIGDDFLL